MKLKQIAMPAEGTMFIHTAFRAPGQSTSWIDDGYAQLWGPTQYGDSTHLHIFNRDLAVQGWKLGKLQIPASVVTVSYEKGS